ncbi:MAG: sulfotransferase [Bacteroidetes bacterium]|nr:sulfotransferase [Bacteroidota bacterium]
MNDTITVIYIISDRRSGSTLLENILSKSTETVSVGELAMLKGHIAKQGPGEIWHWNCSCGQPVLQCSFWSKALNGIYNDNFETKITWPYKSSKALMAAMLPVIAKNNLKQFIQTKKNRQTTESLDVLYQAIAKTSGKNFIVDSSKDPLQGLSIQACANVEAKYIWLSRDLRAITFSKLKRWKVNKRSEKKPLETLTDSFYYKKICSATLKSLQQNNFIKIEYEDVAANPQHQLDKICSFIGLKNYEAPQYMELSEDHTIAGTPGRFERKPIAADNSWKTFYSTHKVLNFLGKVFNSL